MKARILKPCTVVCNEGSIVEITEGQFLALGNSCEKIFEEVVKEESKDELKEEKTTAKKTTKKK